VSESVSRLDEAVQMVAPVRSSLPMSSRRRIPATLTFADLDQ